MHHWDRQHSKNCCEIAKPSLNFSTITSDIEIGFAHDAYSVFESEGEISVEVILHQLSAPSFPIPVTVEVLPHDTGKVYQSLFTDPCSAVHDIPLQMNKWTGVLRSPHLFSLT